MAAMPASALVNTVVTCMGLETRQSQGGACGTGYSMRVAHAHSRGDNARRGCVAGRRHRPGEEGGVLTRVTIAARVSMKAPSSEAAIVLEHRIVSRVPSATAKSTAESTTAVTNGTDTSWRITSAPAATHAVIARAGSSGCKHGSRAGRAATAAESAPARSRPCWTRVWLGVHAAQADER